MKLKIKDVDLSTGGTVVAVLHNDDAERIGVNAGDRIKLSRLRKKDTIITVADIATSGIKQGEIGLFEEALKLLGVQEDTHIDVQLSESPKSLQYIRKKLDKSELKKEEFYQIVKDIVENRLSDREMTYFVSACYMAGLSLGETAHLTNAIVDTGARIKLDKKIIADKHCIGGVGNNRTTMIVIPIVASLGITIPKTSSRAITSPAGTADTMEVLAPVALDEKKIHEVIVKTNGCIVWGGNTHLAAADDKLIRTRHPMRLDPEGMLLASILAKKKAVGSTHVLIDIPYGYSAKFEKKKEAVSLAKKFVKLGKMLGMKIRVILTDGSQPVGNGIGPALEAADVISVLQNDGPNDLRQKAIHMATELLRMVGVKDAAKKAIEALDSGAAYTKMLEIIQAQGGKKNIKFPKAKYSHEILAQKDGTVAVMNNKGIAKIAFCAGAPTDKAAGIYLRVHKGIMVKKGDGLFTIYSNTKSKLQGAVRISSEFENVVIR